MAVAALTELFFNPPIALARLGSSPTPVESFTWCKDPSRYGAGRTAIAPAVSFEIGPDHVPRPYLPSAIHFKDEFGTRPTAPFFELWAVLDRGGTRTEEPVTLPLLHELGIELRNVSYELRLANRKAARRSGDEASAFRAYAQRNATEFGRVPLDATSTTSPGGKPLVVPEHPIPLGMLHVLQPVIADEMSVDLSVLRVRFIPAKGLVYGPPEATAAFDPDTMRLHELVPPENRILNPAAAWCAYDADYAKYQNPEPSDTYDGADAGGPNPNGSPNWGVVDDTCDGVLTARLQYAGKPFIASARVAVAPPDYAPDRRFFLSLADDLCDRDAPPIDDPSADEIIDLFQRVFETVSLLNLDYTRDRAINENSPTDQLTSPAKPPRRDAGTMTYLDAGYAVKAPVRVYDTIPSPIDPANIPPGPQAGRFANAALDIHEPLADEESLLDFLRANADRVRSILRPPWAPFADLVPHRTGVKVTAGKGGAKRPALRDARSNDDTAHDMRMPPYMRDESAAALSITLRQYRMVMSFLDKVVPPANARAAAVKADGGALARLSPAERHMHDVLQRRRARKPAAAKAAAPAAPAAPPAKRGTAPKTHPR